MPRTAAHHHAVSVRFLLLLAIAAAGMFGAVAIAVSTGTADSIDQRVALAIHERSFPVADVVMIAASAIGGSAGIIVIVALIAAWTASQQRWRTTAILILGSAAPFVLSPLLKQVFVRARPTLFYEIPLPTTYSFPSGHAMTSIVVFGTIAAVVAELAPRLRRVALVAAVILILLSGGSRVYLGVHWPSDVVAGYAGGVPLLVYILYLLHRRTAAA